MTPSATAHGNREGSPHRRWLGIDFSGNHLMWRPACSRSNVWIADVRERNGQLVLHNLDRVQALPGGAVPFARLAALLSDPTYLAAAIDAPFSIPAVHASQGGHQALLSLVAQMPCHGRPFPPASDFVQVVAGQAPPLSPPKPYRVTEAHWIGQGINVRSTLWAGSRGGAPMTAACIRLLAQAGRPVWPWSHATPGLIVEAFPTAQLQRWGLPFTRYDGNEPTAVAIRMTILAGIAQRIALGGFQSAAAGSADALDALVAAFAAVAVTRNALAHPVTPLPAMTEGWIAVHA
jgi:hypothetical protein